MTPFFAEGDRVRVKHGPLIGAEGVIREAMCLSEPDGPWSLMVEARAFDGSKVFAYLSETEVELIGPSTLR